MPKKGFTLIEVLIVISIIAVLASILIVAVMGTIDPVKVRTTDRRIKILEDGLKRFVDMFETRHYESTNADGRGYPRLEEFSNVTILGKSVDKMTGGEFLRLILYPTDEELEELKKYGISKRVFADEEVSEMLNDDNDTFVDSWGFSFFYEFPGMNHSDKGTEKRNHQNWKEQFGYNHRAKRNPKPDIWSAGMNNVSDETLWESELNDPFSETDSENDDITNWFVNER